MKSPRHANIIPMLAHGASSPHRALRAFAAAMLALAVAGIGGCAGTGTRVCVAGDMVVVTDSSPTADDAAIFDSSSRQVRLSAAGNETVSFQIIFDAWQGAERLAVSWGELQAAGGRTISPASIRAFRALSVATGEVPSWYPLLIGPPPPSRTFDALVPVDAKGAAQPYRLQARERLVLWFDVAVPRDAKPGVYQTVVSLDDGEARLWDCRLALTVGDFVLGGHRPVSVVGGFDHRQLFATMVRREGRPYVPAWLNRRHELVWSGLTAMRQMMRLAREHHVDLFDTSIRPLLKRDSQGAVRLDWNDYDAIVSPYLAGSAFDDGLPSPAWPLPVTADWPLPDSYGGATRGEYLSTVQAVLADSRQHFQSCPWAEGKFFAWLDRSAPAGYGQADGLLRLVHAEMPDVPVLRPLPPGTASEEAAPAEASGSEMLIGPAAAQASVHWATAAANPLAGRWLDATSSLAGPSLGRLASPCEVRALPWLAMVHGCRGVFIEQAFAWDEQGPIADSELPQLFYPGSIAGTDQVLASVRLKQLRRGLEDLAYVSILDQRGKEQTAREIAGALAPPASGLEAGAPDEAAGLWALDPLAWQLAQRLLAEEAAAAVRAGRGGEPSLMIERLAWERYWDRIRTVAVRRTSCKVHAAPASGAMAASASLYLVNELSGAVSVQVAWQTLPPGWTGLHGSDTLSPLQGNWSRNVTLTAAGAALPPSDNGKPVVSVSMTIEGQQPRTVILEVPVIQAQAVAATPAIDGQLDDWLAQTNNVAGDFVLLPRRDRPATPAYRQTQVFAARDRRYLYLAFRCLGAAAKAAPSPGKTVRYEQTVACGEELVEVLLDPGNSAKSIEDLYHIAVRADGTVVCERGVAAGPPLPPARPWETTVKVAVARTEGLWTIEMAVPLESFGPAGAERFWGVNFLRFSPPGLEASSWSPANGWFYDPKSMGTMILSGGEPAAGSAREGSR